MNTSSAARSFTSPGPFKSFAAAAARCLRLALRSHERLNGLVMYSFADGPGIFVARLAAFMPFVGYAQLGPTIQTKARLEILYMPSAALDRQEQMVDQKSSLR